MLELGLLLRLPTRRSSLRRVFPRRGFLAGGVGIVGEPLARFEEVVEGEASGAEDGDEGEDGELRGVALSAGWRRWWT